MQFDVLTKLYGTSGDLDASKIIKNIVLAVIEPQLLAMYTMTGKTDKVGVRKLKFKTFVNVLKCFKRVLLAADKTYNETKFKKDFTYKVIKPAYKELVKLS